MGTRHLTVVVVDGIHRVAQYGQWDGYPDGQGRILTTILHDILTTNRLSEFEDKVRALKWVADDEVERRWPGNDKELYELYPEWGRDTGAEILQIVLDGGAPHGLCDNITFGLDSLFCEFAYVVDLDAKTIEFYKGFNKDPAKNAPRFMALPDAQAHLDKENKDRNSATRYEAVTMVGTFTFDELMQEGAQAIVDRMNKLIGDDEDEG